MRISMAASLAAFLLAAAPVAADDIRSVLRITGNIKDGAAAFDMDALRALPQATLVTSTVVTDGTHRFTGFLMRDLLDRVEAEGDLVEASALNDYVVEIPARDFRTYDVIVAYTMDGAPLDRADKGPLWIVYPRDDHRELQDIRYDYRWVWQLSGLDIK